MLFSFCPAAWEDVSNVKRRKEQHSTRKQLYACRHGTEEAVVDYVQSHAPGEKVRHIIKKPGRLFDRDYAFEFHALPWQKERRP